MGNTFSSSSSSSSRLLRLSPKQLTLFFSQHRRKFLIAGIITTLTTLFVFLVVKLVERNLLFKMGLRRNSILPATTNLIGGNEKGRYLIKLLSDCSIEQKIASRVLVSKTLGGPSALAAVLEGSANIQELLVIDTHASSSSSFANSASVTSAAASGGSLGNHHNNNNTNQNDEGGGGGGGGEESPGSDNQLLLKSGVIGLAMLKQGAQDIELRSEIFKAERFLKKIREEEKESVDQQQEDEKVKKVIRISTQLTKLGFTSDFVLSEAKRLISEDDEHKKQGGKKEHHHSNDQQEEEEQEETDRRSVLKYPLPLFAAELNSLAVHEQHRGRRIGIHLGSVAMALASNAWGVTEIQGNAASESLVIFYKKASAGLVGTQERDRYFILPLVGQFKQNRQTLLDRAKTLPEYLVLDQGLKRTLKI